jgi:hypothetical protein
MTDRETEARRLCELNLANLLDAIQSNVGSEDKRVEIYKAAAGTLDNMRQELLVVTEMIKMRDGLMERLQGDNDNPAKLEYEIELKPGNQAIPDVFREAFGIKQDEAN